MRVSGERVSGQKGSGQRGPSGPAQGTAKRLGGYSRGDRQGSVYGDQVLLGPEGHCKDVGFDTEQKGEPCEGLKQSSGRF